MERKPIPPDIQAAVLFKSARRCALCFHLSSDTCEKVGQIAHLDKDPSNYGEDNLAFLCLEHHTLFDSRTSQHKNYTIEEVKAARRRLHDAIALQGNSAKIHPDMAHGWEVRYPGTIYDVSLVHRGDQRPSRFAIARDFTLINSSPHQVSLNVIFLIVYGYAQLAADPMTLPPPEWSQLLAGFGIRNKSQLTFPLNLPGRSSVEGHIVFPVQLEGAGRGIGGDLPNKRQYLFEFEDLLTKSRSTLSASAIFALDKSWHQRVSPTDLALPGPHLDPLIVD